MIITPLYDIAYDAANDQILSSGQSFVFRFDRDPPLVIDQYAMPRPSARTGLQLLPTTASLRGVEVPQGSLLITSPSGSPDMVYAVNAADGAPIAELPLIGEIDPVGGVYHPGTNSLLLMDPHTDDIVRIDPNTGLETARFNAPIPFTRGGLALGPIPNEVWMVSNNSSSIFAFDAQTGVNLRSIDLSTNDVGPVGASGVSFIGNNRVAISSLLGFYREYPLTLFAVAATASTESPARVLWSTEEEDEQPKNGERSQPSSPEISVTHAHQSDPDEIQTWYETFTELDAADIEIGVVDDELMEHLATDPFRNQ